MINLIAGFDPGFANLGAGVLTAEERPRVVLATNIETDPVHETQDRIATLWQAARGLLVANQCCAIGIEAQAGVFAAKSKVKLANSNSAMVREVVGMLRTLALELGIPLYEAEPRVMRQVMGLSADATKAQMEAVLRRLTVGVPEKLPNHAADALVVGYLTQRAVRAQMRRRIS